MSSKFRQFGDSSIRRMIGFPKRGTAGHFANGPTVALYVVSSFASLLVSMSPTITSKLSGCRTPPCQTTHTHDRECSTIASVSSALASRLPLLDFFLDIYYEVCRPPNRRTAEISKSEILWKLESPNRRQSASRGRSGIRDSAPPHCPNRLLITSVTPATLPQLPKPR
ncbi:hypothetical protein BDZ97DRAFT_1766988 [Flammula alnicola]|nr:hypothetical protein BDZ97DRAFT_1766988 [Flammula alnicola]